MQGTDPGSFSVHSHTASGQTEGNQAMDNISGFDDELKHGGHKPTMRNKRKSVKHSREGDL